jgi:hypothetical protein
MNLTSQVRKIALTAGVVTLATGAAIAGTAVSASAAVAHTFKICAYGNYTAYGEVPQQGGFSTELASPGQCKYIPLENGSTYAKVWGLYNTHPNVQFYVGTAHFSASTGWSGAAEGTTTSPWLRNFG